MYAIEEKDRFTVLGIGAELKSDYMDQAGITKEKESLWQAVLEDGRLEKLKSVAANDFIFAVNEAYNDKMMHYIGVMTEQTLPEADRLIEFPEGEYVVVKGEGKTFEELSNTLTGTTFGQALAEASEVEYIGGPNTVVVMGQKDGLYFGEMWVPVVRK